MRPGKLLLALLLVAASCDGEASGPSATTIDRPTPTPTATTNSWWSPAPTDTWQWQLEGAVNTSYDVAMFDIDLFDSPIETISTIQSRGAHVICYFSAGSWEEWRPDAGDFDASTLGTNLADWEGERWLDVRHASVRSVMEARLDLAATKGCDGVEPDNVDGYDNNTGFDFGREDQVAFNRWLAEQAHGRDLSIGLKNALGLIDDLGPSFDFAVNEQCWEYDECGELTPFVESGKAVFSAEYHERFVNDPGLICRRAAAAGLRTLIMPLALDDSMRISCDEC